jgi:hypothetical protein
MNIVIEEDRQQPELPFWQQATAFLVACAALISRRPDAILHPQFWAEDGHVWFAEAYNLGWGHALFRTYAGYFQTLPRLGAALAQLVPLAFAPLAMNLIAVAVQALPVSLLLSSRSSAWGSLRYRALMAAIYLALPNMREIGAILTNSQWVLALAAFLVLAALTPKTIAGKVFDAFVLLLCGLTGPFCVFLFPIAVWIAWRRRDAWRWAESGILAAACLIQAWALLVMDRAGRADAALGAGPALLTRIVGGHVFLGTLLGGNQLASYAGAAIFLLLLGAAIVGATIVALCFTRTTVEMKLLLLFCFAIFGAALISPESYPDPGLTRWQSLAAAGGVRYWFLPSLAFAWSLLWCAHSRSTVLKRVSAVLLFLMCFGIVRDWELPAFANLHFAEEAKRFEAAPSGTAVVIPENPQGWTLVLKRKTSQ